MNPSTWWTNGKRHVAIVAIVLIGIALLMAWLDGSRALAAFPGAAYLQSWFGGCLRIVFAAYIGFLICRHLLRIDLSEIATRFPDQSPEQAFAVAAGQVARAVVVGAAIVAASLMT